jgi:hypothetical protein
MQGLPFILMPLCWALALSLRCSPLLARPGLLSLLGPKTRHHERSVILILKICWALVAHTCNPSYSGGRDQEDRG